MSISEQPEGNAGESATNVGGNWPTCENRRLRPATSARGRSRNPLALVVVALVAAAMLYVGFHMAAPVWTGSAGDSRQVDACA